MKRIFILMTALTMLMSCGKNDIVPPTTTDKEAAVETPGNNSETTTPTVENNIIVGYATYWDSVLPDPTLLTHINYSFAHIKNDFESLDIKTSSRLKKIVALKEKNPDLKVCLAVGGWGAGNFSEMAADENHRKKFCENCVKACETYNLDGIDLDWEYPTSSSAGISSSPNDTKNFNLLVAELKEALGENRVLTMASSSSAKYVDFKTAIKYLDWVNIMSYDMGKPPQHNSGLHSSSMTKRSCEEAVKFHYQAGVPYSKMTLGMPFYGHGNEKDFKEGIYFNKIKTDGYTEKWDDKAMVPYLVNESGTMVLTYDNERSIGLKADFVKSKGLLGAMYWNIEGDDKNWTLSKAIASRLLDKAE